MEGAGRGLGWGRGWDCTVCWALSSFIKCWKISANHYHLLVILVTATLLKYSVNVMAYMVMFLSPVLLCGCFNIHTRY